MINNYSALLKREFDKVDEKLVFPLSTWLSNYEANLAISQKLNRDLFYLNKEVSKVILFDCFRTKPYLKYPKSKKVDNTKIDIIHSILKKYYKFSNRDLSSAHKIIISLFTKKELVEKFAGEHGLDNNERKILGLNPIKIDKKLFEKPKTGKSLIDF